MSLLGFCKGSFLPVASRRPPRRTSLHVERLEGREVPAALAFVSPAAIYGSAAVNGAPTSSVRSLLSSNSGDIARQTNGWSQAYSSLSNYSGASSYKGLTATTSAYDTGATITSATGLARTTVSGGGYNYVTVQVVASANGEQQGQTVQVTLTPSFVSTIGWANSGSASNSFSFYVNGQQYLGGTATAKTTATYAKTITLNTTIGSTFQIAFQSRSYVGFAGSGQSNTASMQFSLGMQVSSSGGGSYGGGSYGGGSSGLYSAPPAPNKPTWSSAGGNDIYLHWNDVAGETSYRVYYWSSSTSKWVYLTTLGANATSVRINYGLGYYFTVGATNSYGTTFSPYMLAQ